jgi:hypothetical protein
MRTRIAASPSRRRSRCGGVRWTTVPRGLVGDLVFNALVRRFVSQKRNHDSALNAPTRNSRRDRSLAACSPRPCTARPALQPILSPRKPCNISPGNLTSCNPCLALRTSFGFRISAFGSPVCARPGVASFSEFLRNSQIFSCFPSISRLFPGFLVIPR